MRGAQRVEGFTLIELIIVLVIAATLMAVTPPLVRQALPGVELKSATRHVASALRYARSRAATGGEEAVVTFDLEGRTIQTEGRPRAYALPESLKLVLLTADSETEGEQLGRVRFYPDGSSTGGRVTLSLERNPEYRFAVDVDWLTGRVRVLDDPDA